MLESRMWQVEPNCELPVGFTVWEDVHACQLRDGQGKVVMTWDVSGEYRTGDYPTAEDIQKAAQSHLERLSQV